jgi:hypothetical protein
VSRQKGLCGLTPVQVASQMCFLTDRLVRRGARVEAYIGRLDVEASDFSLGHLAGRKESSPLGMTEGKAAAKTKRPASKMLAALKFWNANQAFMLTDSCALRAFSSFLRREALLRWERSFMNALAST